MAISEPRACERLRQDHDIRALAGRRSDSSISEAGRSGTRHVATVAYIEGYYNRQRFHSALRDITPEQAERKAN